MPSEETTKGDIIYVIIFDIVAIVILLATVKFRNKVKDAMGLEWEWKKPWTWFVSYTGKFFGICLIYPVMKILTLVPFIFGFLFSAAASSRGGSSYSSSSGSSSGGDGSSVPKKQNYYCEYCGLKFSSIRSLTMSNCSNHPDGYAKGKHKLYEGSEKSEYYCKYCGLKFSSIRSLTMSNCSSHPDGYAKGKHAPAL